MQFTWSGALLNSEGGSNSSASLISLLYPNFLSTVHVVSSLPFSMKSACRNRNPVNVSPTSFTPSGNFSCTTLLTPSTSEGCSGAWKHLTYLRQVLGASLGKENCNFFFKEKVWRGNKTWNAFNSASLSAPSLSWSQSIKMRFKALTHRGFNVWVSWSNRGAVGWMTVFCA